MASRGKKTTITRGLPLGKLLGNAAQLQEIRLLKHTLKVDAAANSSFHAKKTTKCKTTVVQST